MEEVLSLRLDYEDPLELTALSKALTRIGQRYTRFSKADDLPEATLVIKHVRQNCLIIDLTPIAVAAGAIISASEPINNAVAFAQNLKTLVDFLLGKGPRPESVTKSDLDDVREIVQPVAVQRDGGICIQASGESEVSVTINLNSVEANAVQNRAEQEKARLTESSSRIVPEVEFYWHVAGKGAAASDAPSPDRGIIEKVDKRDRRVRFADPDLKTKMIAGVHSFENVYIVDVEVVVLQDRIQYYKILDVRDSFPMED